MRLDSPLGLISFCNFESLAKRGLVVKINTFFTVFLFIGIASFFTTTRGGAGVERLTSDWEIADLFPVFHWTK